MIKGDPKAWKFVIENNLVDHIFEHHKIIEEFEGCEADWTLMWDEKAREVIVWVPTFRKPSSTPKGLRYDFDSDIPDEDLALFMAHAYEEVTLMSPALEAQIGKAVTEYTGAHTFEDRDEGLVSDLVEMITKLLFKLGPKVGK